VSAVRPVCEWFLGCKQPAVAIVSHPRKPTPACARCIDRMGLRDKVIATILAAPNGDTVVMPTARGAVHVDEHFFRNVCICPCAACTEHVEKPLGAVMCTCRDCDLRACGARQPGCPEGT